MMVGQARRRNACQFSQGERTPFRVPRFVLKPCAFEFPEHTARVPSGPTQTANTFPSPRPALIPMSAPIPRPQPPKHLEHAAQS
jgi:hypothetical protein